MTDFAMPSYDIKPAYRHYYCWIDKGIDRNASLLTEHREDLIDRLAKMNDGKVIDILGNDYKLEHVIHPDTMLPMIVSRALLWHHLSIDFGKLFLNLGSCDYRRSHHNNLFCAESALSCYHDECNKWTTCHEEALFQFDVYHHSGIITPLSVESLFKCIEHVWRDVIAVNENSNVIHLNDIPYWWYY